MKRCIFITPLNTSGLTGSDVDWSRWFQRWRARMLFGPDRPENMRNSSRMKQVTQYLYVKHLVISWWGYGVIPGYLRAFFLFAITQSIIKRRQYYWYSANYNWMQTLLGKSCIISFMCVWKLNFSQQSFLYSLRLCNMLLWLIITSKWTCDVIDQSISQSLSPA